MSPYTFHINLYDLIFVGTIFIGLTFILQLWFTKRINRAANRFLALALATVVLWIVWVLGVDIGLTAYFPHWNWLPLQFLLALGPLIYFFVLKTTRPEYKFRLKDLLHFSPLLLQQGALVWEVRTSIRTGAATYDTLLFQQFNPVLQVLVVISVGAYLYASHLLIARFYQTLKFNGGDRHRYELRWLRNLLIAFGLCWLLWIPFTAVDHFYYHNQLSIYAYYPLYLLLAVMAIWTSAVVFLRPEVSVPSDAPWFLKPVTPVELKHKAAWLKKAVKTKGYFEDPELSLVSLAEKLDLTTHELSRIINTGLKKSFNDFINEFRVVEVARKMENPAYDHITLLGIAFESGFNSKSTFNRAFRQMTGKSAAEHKNELKKQRPSYNLTHHAQFAAIFSYQQTTPQWSDEKLNRNYMFKNYLKIAWRNIVNGKISSLINIGGLMIGMAVTMLISLWIWDELSFNKQFQNYDHIAQVMKNATYEGTLNTDGSNPIPLGTELRSSYGSNFKYVVMSFGNAPHIITFAEKEFSQPGNFMEPDAPKMLTLKMLNGTRAGLKDQKSILLSETLSKKLFSGSDPLGKIIKIDNKLDVKVMGVYQDLPSNSDFKDLTFIAPFDLWLSSQQNGNALRDDWNSEFVEIYVQINPNANFSEVSAKIKNVTLKHVNGEKLREKAALFLQPMGDWHLYSKFENGVKVTSDQLKFVWFYSIIGIFVLILACINFMNLSTARSAKRAKEIGIRKAIGSIRGQLIGQFFFESLLTSVLAFLFAIILVQIALPWFGTVTDKIIVIPVANPIFWLVSLTFIIITGLLAGSYPALYLSSFKTVNVLKGAFHAGRFSAVPRKVLVVFQFTISVTLIIGTLVVYRQIQFAKNRPVGYSRDGLVQIQMTSPEFSGKFDVLKNELNNTGVVAEVAQSQSPLTDIWNTKNGFDWKGASGDTSKFFGTIKVSNDYGKTIGWQIMNGRDFSSDFANDSSGFVINEAAAKLMGLKNPIGQTISVGGKQPVNFTVLGVVKDVVMRSPYKLAFPTIYHLGKGGWTLVRIRPNVSMGNAMPKIRGVLKKLFPSSLLDYKFADENYAVKFAAEEHIANLASFFAIPAIFISCLGLFGLAVFMAEQHTKEIGIRKVLGATVFNVWQMMSKDFVVLIIISLSISIPTTYYFMHNWLENYEYRTALSWWIFAGAGMGTIIITLLTVSFQTIKAAMANPVESLRSE